MSVYDKLEKWKDGSIRYIERDDKGHFKTSSNKKLFIGQKVGVWNTEPQQKIVPEINHKDFVSGDFYRACISLNIPLNGTKHKSNYKNFTYVVIDKLENINLREMHKELIAEIEDSLHYKNQDFWFDCAYSDCDIQNPKPYSAKSASKTFEGN